MKILILGGTKFVGRTIVEKLQNSFPDYSLTLFNRNQSNPLLFPGISKLIGDRETKDIDKITDQNWDCIIDVSSYYPDSLKHLLAKLKGKVGKYIYISTANVYNFEKPIDKEIKEEGEVVICAKEQRMDKSMSSYASRKIACEQELLDAQGLDKVIFRPSIIYGKYDDTDRLYYWIYRIATQKEILLPSGGLDRLHLTYMEDFAGMVLEAIGQKLPSVIYNVPTHPVSTFKEYLISLEKVIGKSPDYVNMSPEIAEKESVVPGMDLPLWFNGSYLIFDYSKSKKDFEYAFTDFDTSISKTLQYYLDRGLKEGSAGMKVEREEKIIYQLKS